ncbi:MAG: pitrilysin family protein [bacterium]
MNYSKKQLSNGLRIITIPKKDTLAVTVLVLVEAGSKYENKENNGLSHFLEHMCFKGTKNRPKAMDISSELDSLGAQYNAFTGHEFTGYYAKVSSNHFDKALDIVSDLYLNPTFNEAEIEKEKGVIVEEINMYEDLPQHKVQDLFMEVLYGDQPAGWNIAGKKEVVRVFNKDNFLKYRGEHYVSSSTIVVVAGNFDEEKALKDIELKFAGMSTGEKSKKEKVIEVQSSPIAFVKNKSSDQTHLVLGVRTFGINDSRNYTMDVISWILGGGMSSRLFQKIREELGAAYYIRCTNNSFTDHGFLEASAGADNKRVKEVIKAVLEEFGKLKKDKVEEKELSRIKDSIVGNIFLGLETSDSVANFLGSQEVLKGKMITPEEYAENIKKVTAEEILEVSNLIFDKSKLNLALIGPFEDGDGFVSLLDL